MPEWNKPYLSLLVDERLSVGRTVRPFENVVKWCLQIKMGQQNPSDSNNLKHDENSSGQGFFTGIIVAGYAHVARRNQRDQSILRGELKELTASGMSHAGRPGCLQ
jgi:hypothetical protein